MCTAAMYVIIFISAIVFPIVFLLKMDPSTKQLIAGIGFAIAAMSAMCATFVPKIYLLLQGADLDSKMGIVFPNGKVFGGGATGAFAQ